MIDREIMVLNKKGIHARPASQIVQVASTFSAKINIIHNNNEINAKSIIGILTLGVTFKEKIILRIEGVDEERAMKKLAHLFEKILM